MQRVTRLLAEEGPMTGRDVAAALGISVDHARGALGKAKASRQIRIVGYRRDADGGRIYPRAIYAAGPGRDAPRLPPSTATEISRRLRDRKRGAVASVWDLATPVDERRLGAVTQ